MKYKKTFFLIVFLIMIFSFACGDEKKNLNKEFEIQIIKGQIANDLEKIKVNKGEIVKISFKSDSSDLIHIHGYDIEKKIIPTETAIIEFQADATGRFRITAHKENDAEHRERLLLILEVYP